MGPVEILMLIALVVVAVFVLLCWSFWRLVSAIGYRIGLYLSGGTSDGGQIWRRRIRYAVFIGIPGCYIILQMVAWGNYKYHCARYEMPIIYETLAEWQQKNSISDQELRLCNSVTSPREVCLSYREIPQAVQHDNEKFTPMVRYNRRLVEYTTKGKYLMFGYITEYRDILYDVVDHYVLSERRVYEYFPIRHYKGSVDTLHPASCRSKRTKDTLL